MCSTKAEWEASRGTERKRQREGTLQFDNFSGVNLCQVYNFYRYKFAKCLEYWYRLIRFVGFSGFKIARICNLLARAWACRWARAVVVALVCWRDEGWTGRNTEPVLQSNTNSAKARKEKKRKVSRSIHPVIVLVCAVTKVYISNFVACFSERDGRCDVVIQSPVSLETSAKVKSMLFPRPDTAYLWGIKAEKMTVDWGYVLCAAMHRSSIESTTSDESPWSIRRWWICPSCKKRTRIGIAQCSATRSFATALVTTEKIAMCALQWKDRCNYRCHSRRFLYSYDSYQVLARERLSMLVSDFTWKVGGMSSQFFFDFSKSRNDAVVQWHMPIWIYMFLLFGCWLFGQAHQLRLELARAEQAPAVNSWVVFPHFHLLLWSSKAAVDVQSYFSTNRGSPRKDKDLILQLKVFDWRNDLLWSTLQWLQ